VVYRVDGGRWQRVADIVTVDRADLKALLVAFKAFQDDVPDLDPIMREAYRGIIARIEHGIGDS
jgi:hypothetical protein